MADTGPVSPPLVGVVGGDGIWGRAVVEVLTAHLPEARVESVGPTFEEYDAWLSRGVHPDVVVLSSVDPEDRILAACLVRDVAVVDLAWSLTEVDVARDRVERSPHRTPVLAPVGWAGSAAAIVLAAAVTPRAVQGTRAGHVDVDVLLSSGDSADDWWWRRFVDLHQTFVVWDKGNRRLARGLGEPKSVRFSDGRSRRARRIASPEQDTVVEAGLAESLSVRVAFERRRTDLWLALLISSGAWRFLPARWRRGVLEPRRTPEPRAHELVVTAAYPESVIRARVVDPAGRAHLTAACALTQVSRLLSADPGCDHGVRGVVQHPESATDTTRDLEILRSLGVLVDVEVLTSDSPHQL